MLVACDVSDRDQLVVEAAGLVRGRPALLGLEREGVLVIARDAVALGDVLAGLAHRLEWEHLLQLRIGEAPPERGVVDRLVAAREPVLGLPQHERGPAHRLDAAGDEEVPVARRDRMRSGGDRRQPGRAQPVDRHAGDRLGQPREQHRHARDVAVVLAGLVGGAEVNVLDLSGVDAGTAHRLADHNRRHIVWTDVRECAAIAPDRRAHRRQDYSSTHASRLADASLSIAASPGSPRSTLYPFTYSSICARQTSSDISWECART